MKKDIQYLHTMRALACVMVVCLHSLPSFETSGFACYFKASIVYFTRPCVPLFFMISGALLFPVKDDVSLFYKKRLLKILYPLLIWGICYSILPAVLDLETTLYALRQIIMLPLTFPVEVGAILWYLYVLLGIYLIAPFINPIIFSRDKKNVLLFFLFLWLLASFADLIRYYNPLILGSVPFSTYNLLTYFSGYIGYCFLGYYLHVYEFMNSKKRNFILFILYALFLLLIPLFSTATDELYWGSFLSINAIFMSSCMFLLVKNINYTNDKLVRVIKNISELSFGIYLSHIFIYRVLTTHLYNVSASPIMQISVMVLTFLGAYLFSFIVSKFSFSKYIIGV